MPRSTLSIVLALILFVGFAITAKADVTGSFDIHITLDPEGNQTEAVKYFIDFQSNLQVNVTLSGLTFSMDLGFGTTGVEFAILGLTTNLGALAINDLFVFAPPFGCTDFTGLTYAAAPAAGAPYLSNDHGNIEGECEGKFVVPIGDSNGDLIVDNDAVGFVKKRVEMELNIAGITLTNLALFEDVDFPDIYGLREPIPGSGLFTNDHEHDHSDGSRLYNIYGADNFVDNQTPTFGFGDVITLSGQTVSGITVTGITGFCADQRNRIKKRSWQYEVNEACTASLGNLLDPGIEEDSLGVGAKTPLLFEFETLIIEGIEVGGVTIDIFTQWKPRFSFTQSGFFTSITASFSVLDLADVSVALFSTSIMNLSADSIVVSISTGNLTLVLYDCADFAAGCAFGLGADLTIDRVDAVLSLVLNPNQNPADLVLEFTVETGTGLTAASASLGISRGVLSLDTTTVFEGTSGQLSWDGTTFSLGVDGGSGISVTAEFEYTPTGMGQSSISLGVTF